MAEQGNVAAQSGLGMMYAQGEGVPRDEVEALVWFTLAARAGDAASARNRAYAEFRVGAAGIRSARLRSDAIQAAIDARKTAK
jgi:TPR repeat protein